MVREELIMEVIREMMEGKDDLTRVVRILDFVISSKT